MVKNKKQIDSEIRLQWKDLSLEYWRLLSAVVTDGTICIGRGKYRAVILEVAKKRKINRIRKLLNFLKIDYRESTIYPRGISKLKRQRFYIRPKDSRDICYLLHKNTKEDVKKLPEELFKESYQIMAIVLAEVIFFDGSIGYGNTCCRLCTSKIEELNLYCRLLQKLGWNYSPSKRYSSFYPYNESYRIYVHLPDKIEFFQGGRIYD